MQVQMKKKHIGRLNKQSSWVEQWNLPVRQILSDFRIFTGHHICLSISYLEEH